MKQGQLEQYYWQELQSTSSPGISTDRTGRKLIKFCDPWKPTGLLWHQQKAEGGRDGGRHTHLLFFN